MIAATVPFTELTRTLQNHTSKLSTLSLDKAKRLAKFNLESAQVVLKQGEFTGRAIAEITDVAAIKSLQTLLADTAVLNARAYSRGVYRVAADAQSEFSKLAEETWTAWQKGVTAWVEAASRNSLAAAFKSPRS